MICIMYRGFGSGGVQIWNSEPPESIICIMYRGSGPECVQISNSELPESIICIMFQGSGPECVQNSNSEHLRGTKYFKIHKKEAKGGPEREWKHGGPARAAGGRNSDFIRGLQNSAGILSLGLTRLEPRWGRRISVRFAEAAALS